MTDRLRIYNGALLLCGERALGSLTEEREPRRLLDLVWNDGGVRYCLEQAQWHFAMRSTRLDYSPSITPDWGYQKAFPKPDDWIITSGVFQDEFLAAPLLGYADEVGYWFADLEEIFVKYVSDDVKFGMDLGQWPATFTEYVKAYFAGQTCQKITGSAAKTAFLLGPPGREDRGWVNRCLMIAKNKAAMTQPTTFPQRGTWAQARLNGMHRGIRDGGSINRLIG